VTVGEPVQVTSYLLSARLADFQFLADTAYSGHLAAGEGGGEQLSGCMAMTVQLGWRFGYRYLGCGKRRVGCWIAYGR